MPAEDCRASIQSSADWGSGLLLSLEFMSKDEEAWGGCNERSAAAVFAAAALESSLEAEGALGDLAAAAAAAAAAATTSPCIRIRST